MGKDVAKKFTKIDKQSINLGQPYLKHKLTNNEVFYFKYFKRQNFKVSKGMQKYSYATRNTHFYIFFQKEIC